MGEVAERINRKNKNLESVLPLTISAQYGLIDQTEFFDKQVASRDVSNYYLLKNGEFAYNKSYSNGYPWGAVKRLDKYDMGVLSTLYIVFSPTCIDSEFLSQYYESAYWHTEVSQYCAEGARNHGLLNIAVSDFFETKLIIPTYKSEQTAIGNFFRTLDDAITLCKRKLDGLKELKSAYLQQMFPQAGESVPRIRFAGFTALWEEKKLGEIAECTTGGGTPSTSNYSYWHGNIPWIQSSDLTEHDIFAVSIRKYVTSQGLEKSAAKLIPKNSIAIVTRVGVGKIAMMPFEYTTSQDFLSLSNMNIDTSFGAYSIYWCLQKELNQVQGTSIKGITKDELLNKSITIPKSIREQTVIGEFFRNLDEQINSYQTKLEQMQQLKSAYLQKMFI